MGQNYAMLQPTKLSPHGPTFSRLVWGVMTWGVWGKNYSTQEMLRLIEYGVEHGITTFDHADIYGHYTTEAEFGQALKGRSGLRQKMQLVTKCGIKLVTPNRPQYTFHGYDTSREHIRWSVEQSLKNLQTDYLDLLLIHRPSPLMHPDDIAEEMGQLMKEGKVRHFGVSNFTPSQFQMLRSRIPLVTNQVEASLLHLDPFWDGTLDQLLEHNIQPMVWSPLGGGKMFTDQEDERVLRIRKVAAELAETRAGATIDQILLAWLLMHPSGILPVLGTGRAERMESAIKALRIQLTRDEWFMLWTASMGEEVP